ncbi:MAG TPA: hypothetical protein V6D30_10320 [Leptolyngbyaceae cyanobacterium]
MKSLLTSVRQESAAKAFLLSIGDRAQTPVSMRCTSEATCQDTDNLRSLVHHWASKIGVNVQQIQLRQMKTKASSSSAWGLACAQAPK